MLFIQRTCQYSETSEITQTVNNANLQTESVS